MSFKTQTYRIQLLSTKNLGSSPYALFALRQLPGDLPVGKTQLSGVRFVDESYYRR